MELSAAENATVEAFSHYVLNGRIDFRLTVGEISAQTELSDVDLNAALSRLLGRSWLVAPTKYLWDDDDAISLCGEGLARAASLAARRDLTLFEIQVGGECYYISYNEPDRKRKQKLWTARAHEAASPGANPVAVAR